jgi:uncharacterized repeat protein (TIGR03803 family)
VGGLMYPLHSFVERCMKSGLLTFALLVSSLSIAQNYKVIHSFAGYPNDGLSPVRSVIFDKAGNMYGTTPGGGNQTGCGDLGCGVAYELAPDGRGNWTEMILYNFCQNFDGISCLDGAYPNGLTMDTTGNLYGTTFSGGTGQSGSGAGVAFELSPPSNQGGAWHETVLYNFCSTVFHGSCVDGWVGSVGPLVLDNAGNLYGTAGLGGTGHVTGGEGLVFRLSRGSAGWKERILHNFCTQGQGDECPDGYEPGGGVTFDKSGNLYGTTAYSGNITELQGGTLFELSPEGGTAWKYKSLVTIPTGTEPSQPLSPICFDARGNLYSTLAAINGGVFRINAKSHKLSIFKFNGSDGAGPSGVYIDNRKNVLYGTTGSGGVYGVGTIYAIDATGQESVLYSFCQQGCTDGEAPSGTPAPDSQGNLHGTAEFGGEYGPGVIFEFTP